MMGFLADLVVLFHLIFVLFVVFGGFFVLKRTWLAWVHIPAVIWGTSVEFLGWICPLTPIENWLRQKGGGRGYESGFIDQYLTPLLYPSDLTREGQILLGLAALILNLTIYFVVFRRIRTSSSDHRTR